MTYSRHMETPRVGNVYLFPTPDRARATAPQPDRRFRGQKIGKKNKTSKAGSTREPKASSPQWPPKEELPADVLYTNACKLEDVGEIEAAKALYQDLLRLHPDHAQGHVNLGRIFHVQGFLDVALDCYDRALDIDHLDEVAGFNRSVVLEDLGWTKEAIRSYRHVLRRHPDCADAHYNVGRLLDLAGEPEEATKHLIRYRQLSKKDAG